MGSYTVGVAGQTVNLLPFYGSGGSTPSLPTEMVRSTSGLGRIPFKDVLSENEGRGFESHPDYKYSSLLWKWVFGNLIYSNK